MHIHTCRERPAHAGMNVASTALIAVLAFGCNAATRSEDTEQSGGTGGVQTAVGSWVREAGKRDVGRLRSFLDRFAGRMPRTALRMAIEHLDADERHHYRSLTDRPHPSQDSDETGREPS